MDIEWKDALILILSTMLAIFATPLGTGFEHWFQGQKEKYSEAAREKRIQKLTEEYKLSKKYRDNPTINYPILIIDSIRRAAYALIDYATSIMFFLCLIFLVTMGPENAPHWLSKLNTGIFSGTNIPDWLFILIAIICYCATLFFVIDGRKQVGYVIYNYRFACNIRELEKYEKENPALVKELEESVQPRVTEP